MHQIDPLGGHKLKVIKTSEPKSVLARKIMRLLDGLHQSATGKAIYAHVQHTLRDFESSQMDVQDGYAKLLSMLLDAYGKHLAPDSPEKVDLKLMQMRLTPPLSISEINALKEITKEFVAKLASSDSAEYPEFQTEISNILTGLGFAANEYQATTKQPHVASATLEAHQDSVLSPLAPQEPVPAKAWGQVEGEHAVAKDTISIADIATHSQETLPDDLDAGNDGALRKILEGNRLRIQHIQTTLSQQLNDAIRQSEQFGVLLELEREEVLRSETIENLSELKEVILSAVEKLIGGNRSLANKFDNTQNYLKILESNSQQLGDELARVHLLSMTDELTHLPNRRAFMRRLEDEIGRVQRYGYPLTLVLIDLDHFKAINDNYGHAGGDEALRVFCQKVLAIFRHHDMVARYGGEEFAVILPNTNHEGAVRALIKVRQAAAETTIKFNDVEFPLTTFSAGVTMYRPGETPSSLIERADIALYRAKNLGRNRIETEHFDGADS
ncbi:GGDEF domain-containing protein [Beggiatoa alba]|nr:GGDEF domain-containing protein [Beggiatoa alba]